MKKTKKKKGSFDPCTLFRDRAPCLAPARVWRIRAIPRRIRAVAWIAFGRSCSMASRRHALEWRPRAVPWRVRALPLVALGKHSGIIAPPCAPHGALARCPGT
ncbi:hypothetical protein PIB30_088496 [Stylosanthes scabra]|uniref:Uncharacterized protein n=1 Tax=Stylosanthes scabra TaxID=79078 RepID=A0ABU6SVG4_9FABA|nr:hypothetical protein [Stylosanthes scabra]